jgi:hypothetical protein
LLTGSHLVAVNEVIALSVPKRCDFGAAIPGGELIDFLAASSAPIVDLAPIGDSEVRIRLGDSELTLPRQAPGDWAWNFQALTTPPQQNLVAGVTAPFLGAIEHCLQSVNANDAVAEETGVTLVRERRDLHLYATDRQTLSHAQLKLPQLPKATVPQRTVLTGKFCQQALRLAAQAQTTRFALYGDHVRFMADEVVLFGRLIAVDNPLDFEDTVARLLPQDWHNKAIQIPKQLGPVLEQAARITKIKGAEIKSRIKISKGLATISSQSRLGQAEGRLALPRHPDVDTSVFAPHLLKALPGAAQLLITKDCAILNGGNKLCLVAAYDDD